MHLSNLYLNVLIPRTQILVIIIINSIYLYQNLFNQTYLVNTIMIVFSVWYSYFGNT